MMQITGVKMNIEIKGGVIGGFTFTEDKSTELYNKSSMGVRGSATFNFKQASNSNKWLQSFIDDAEPQKYKIESDIKMKIGDIVGIHCGDIVIKIKITEFDHDNAAIGVFINEQTNKKD